LTFVDEVDIDDESRTFVRGVRTAYHAESAASLALYGAATLSA
jgi:hypothetical protein